MVAVAVLGVLGLWNYKSSERAWNEYKAVLKAKGELVDWTDCVTFTMPPSRRYGNAAASPHGAAKAERSRLFSPHQ
jgi:hypothetical protein